MPQNAVVYRVLIASPSDCIEERRIIPEVIHYWNAIHSLETGAILQPVMWETHARPELGERPQAIINRQLVDKCDILIGAFWTKLGTPTGMAPSGTAEEIERSRAAKKQVLLYFSSKPVTPDSYDPDQYKALKEYRTALQQQGLYSEYESSSEFRQLLYRHLAGAVSELHRIQIHGDSPRPYGINKDELDVFLRRLRLEWESERDSGPYTVDTGKYILLRALDEVLDIHAAIADYNRPAASLLDAVATRIRQLQRHEIYIDGGTSFDAFWSQGDKVISDLEQVRSLIAGT